MVVDALLYLDEICGREGQRSEFWEGSAECRALGPRASIPQALPDRLSPLCTELLGGWWYLGSGGSERVSGSVGVHMVIPAAL